MNTTLPAKPTVASLVERLEKATTNSGYALNALEQASVELGAIRPPETAKASGSVDEVTDTYLYDRLQTAVLKAERNLERLNRQTSLLGNTLGITYTEAAIDVG